MNPVSLYLRVLLVAIPLSAAEPVRTVDAAAAGAVGDGTTLNTAFLQKAIDTCSAQGGGLVRLPAGRYLTGTIQLKDNVTLRLDENAFLLGSTNAADYRNLDPFIDGTGAQMGYALVVAVDARHVGIEGPGTINGQGAAVKAAQKPYTIRPFLVRWVNCTDITVRDVHLLNAGAWTMNFFQCTRALVERVTLRSRGLANNDGIDTDSCDTVRIQDCDLDTGDDSICLKTTSPKPCRNVTVSGCKITSACAAIKLGTESIGDFENIQITDCQIRDTRLGGIKLFSVDGSNLHNVTLADITMKNVAVPIMIRLGARLKTFRQGDVKKPAGTLRDVTIKNINATDSGQIGMLISGIPGHPVENLAFENIDIQLGGGGKSEEPQVQLPEKENSYPEIGMFGGKMPAYGIYARHVCGMSFKNVRTTVKKPDTRPATLFLDVEDVTPAGFATANP